MSWRYEPDEDPKRKHAWSTTHAGFLKIGENLVGKCPSGLTISNAQDLLDGAIAWSPKRWRKSYPQRLYAVDRGVLYRATPTIPGRSYHGFPEHPTRFPMGERDLREQLIRRAVDLGCETELRRWMNW